MIGAASAAIRTSARARTCNPPHAHLVLHDAVPDELRQQPQPRRRHVSVHVPHQLTEAALKAAAEVVQSRDVVAVCCERVSG
jgi:hypothetical protein